MKSGLASEKLREPLSKFIAVKLGQNSKGQSKLEWNSVLFFAANMTPAKVIIKYAGTNEHLFIGFHRISKRNDSKVILEGFNIYGSGFFSQNRDIKFIRVIFDEQHSFIGPFTIIRYHEWYIDGRFFAYLGYIDSVLFLAENELKMIQKSKNWLITFIAKKEKLD